MIVEPDSLIASNPDFYQSYQLAGNEMFRQKNYKQARSVLPRSPVQGSRY